MMVLFLEKEGHIASQAFFQLLQLQGVKVTASDQETLQKQFRDKTSADKIKYKEALQVL